MTCKDGFNGIKMSIAFDTDTLQPYSSFALDMWNKYKKIKKTRSILPVHRLIKMSVYDISINDKICF